MLTLIVAEAELELMPRALLANPRVVARAKKRRRAPSHLVLDQAFDHDAMRGLEDGDRRGRPDIVHMALLLALDSVLARRGAVRVLVHTRSDELIRVRPELRIMRNQAKFVTLAEDLLRQGEVPVGAPLLTLERGRTLESVVHAEARGARVLMDVGGELARGARFAEWMAAGDLTVVVGGFPRGAFRQARPEWFDHVVRVADVELTVWSALVPVLAGCEDALLAQPAPQG